MNMRVKEWSHWAAGYGLPRATLKLFAYRGDPLSRLLIDTRQADNIYPRIEQVRRQYGRVSLVNKVVWVTADAQIVREVLRDHRFRTVKPRDRSPFRLVQWIVAKTDPDLLNPIDSLTPPRPPDQPPSQRNHPVRAGVRPAPRNTLTTASDPPNPGTHLGGLRLASLAS